MATYLRNSAPYLDHFKPLLAHSGCASAHLPVLTIVLCYFSRAFPRKYTPAKKKYHDLHQLVMVTLGLGFNMPTWLQLVTLGYFWFTLVRHGYT